MAIVDLKERRVKRDEAIQRLERAATERAIAELQTWFLVHYVDDEMLARELAVDLAPDLKELAADYLACFTEEDGGTHPSDHCDRQSLTQPKSGPAVRKRTKKRNRPSA